MNLGSSSLLKPIYYRKLWNHFAISRHHLLLNYNEIPLVVYIKCRTSTLIPREYGKIDVIAVGTRWILNTSLKPPTFLCSGMPIPLLLWSLFQKGFWRVFFFNGDKNYAPSPFLFTFNLAWSYMALKHWFIRTHYIMLLRSQTYHHQHQNPFISKGL